MSSEDELRETTQQARFLTPDQLIYSQTQRHDSKILQAAAAVCIDCFTLLYILARIWSHLVFTDSTTAVSIHAFLMTWQLSNMVPGKHPAFLSHRDTPACFFK